MEKEKFQIEFDFKSIPPALLWSYIATPSGLKEWFADEVSLQGKRFTFKWEGGGEQSASIVAQRTESSIRMRWTNEPMRQYFELKILTSELTDSTSLIITDFAAPEDVTDQKELWTSQIDTLRLILGC